VTAVNLYNLTHDS